MRGDSISTTHIGGTPGNNPGGNKVVKVLDIKVNYGKAVKQLGIYNHTLVDIKSAEKDLNDQLKKGTITAATYGRQMAALTMEKKHVQGAAKTVTREIQNNIKAEKEEAGSLVQLRARLSKLTQEYDKMSRVNRNGIMGTNKRAEINQITKEIKEAEAATQRFYRNVGNYQSALTGLQQLGGAFRTFGGIVTGVLGGLGLNELANSMIEVTKNFEDGMARVRSVADPNSSQFNQMRDRALELGRTTRYTASEVANAMEDLARKGYTAAETTEMVGDVLKFAQANVVGMSDAAQVASSTLRSFKLDTSQTSSVVDVMSSACAHSATNIMQLGEAMKTAGPTAQAANISLEETVSLIGSLANVGMTGSDAGTGVKQVIMGLAKASNSTKKAREILKHYNLEITEARIRSGELFDMLSEMKASGIGKSIADLGILVGRYAAPRLANMINSVDETRELKETLKNSVGENDRMYEQSMGKTSYAMMKMKSAWEGLLISMSDETQSTLVASINMITKALTTLNEHIAFVGQTFTSVFATLIAAPAWKGLTSIGSVIKSQWELASVGVSTSAIEMRNTAAAATAEVEALKESEATSVMRLNNMITVHEKALKDEEVANVRLAEREKAIAVESNVIKANSELAAATQLRIKAENAITANKVEQENHRTTITALQERKRNELAEQALIQRQLAEKRLMAPAASRGIYDSAIAKSKAKEIEIIRKADADIANIERRLNAKIAEMSTLTKDLQIANNLELSAKTKLEAEKRKGAVGKEYAAAIEAAKNATAYREQCEARITAIQEEQSAIRTDLSAAEARKRTADTQLMGQAPKVGPWKTFAGFVGGFFKSIGAMIKSFLPLAVVFALTEAIQGFIKLNDLANEAKKTQDEYKQQVKATDIAEDGRLKKLGLQKMLLADITAEHKKHGKISDENQRKLNSIASALRISKELQKDINGNVEATKENYDKINKALDDQKEKQEGLIRQKAYAGIVEDAQANLVKTATTMGLKVSALDDPKAIKDAILDAFNSSAWYEQMGGAVATFFGGEKNFYYYQERAKADYNAIAQVLPLIKPQEDKPVKKTQAGEYDPANLGNSEKDQSAQIEAYIAKYRKLIEDQNVKLVNDTYKKAVAAAEAEEEKINIDIDKLIGKNGILHDKFKKAPQDRVKYLKELIKQVQIYATEVKENRIADAEYNRILKNYDILLKKASDELSLLSANGRNDTMNAFYQGQLDVSGNQYNRDLTAMAKSYYKGEFGGTKRQGSYKNIQKGYDEYYDKVTNLNDQFGRGEISKKEHDQRIAELNEEYKAEAEYFNRRNLLASQQMKKTNEIEFSWLEERHRRAMMYYENELQALQTKYQNELNLAYDHYAKLGFASDAYWEKLKKRIGTQETETLKIRYEMANLEVKQVKERYAKKEISEEEYRAQLQSAQAKQVQVHTDANEAIEKTDAARYQAAQAITQGMIQLTQQMGEEDEGAAKMAKVLALVNIAVNTAEAIAKMTSQEAGKGFPTGLITAASGIATIMANMASAISIVKSAKFAKGKVNIGGAGSETSDSIPAYISRGESVMNAKATKMFEPLLLAMNDIGNGIALPRNNYVRTQQTSDITEAFTNAVAEIRPVVDVREVTRVQNRVETLQNLDTL